MNFFNLFIYHTMTHFWFFFLRVGKNPAISQTVECCWLREYVHFSSYCNASFFFATLFAWICFFFSFTTLLYFSLFLIRIMSPAICSKYSDTIIKFTDKGFSILVQISKKRYEDSIYQLLRFNEKHKLFTNKQ